jgi:hypothetical protein
MLPKREGRTGDKHYIFRQFLDYRLRNPASPPGVLPWDYDNPKWSQPGVRYWAADSPPNNPVPWDCCQPKIAMAVENKFFYSVHRPTQKAPDPTKDDVDRYFARWKTTGIPDRQSFLYHRHSFRTWYETRHAAEVRTGKAENAFRRHAKGKLRKHLWEQFCQANPEKQMRFDSFPKVSEDQMTRLLDLNKGKPLKEYKSWNYNIGENG